MRKLSLCGDDKKFLMDSLFQGEFVETVAFKNVVKNWLKNRCRSEARSGQFTHCGRIVKLGSDLRNDAIFRPLALQFSP